MSDGQVIADKYRLLEQLSRGGMGSVWRAEHIELGTPAAVKLIDPALADTEEALIRFRREAQSAASLRSTNIVQIFDYGVARGIPYIVMELLRGHSLARRLATSDRLSPLETAVILMQVGKAVAWAHSMGVVHRDLKPDNVFLAEDAGETVVKLLDFGIAKTFDVGFTEPPTTITGVMMGTPFYMSPEQAVGERTVDFRADIWAFAVIAFECLTGRRPFHADSVGGLVLAICSGPMPKPSDCAEVPPGFDQWFARAANRDPTRRFLSIREAAVELRRICAKDLDDSALGLRSSNGTAPEADDTPTRDPSASTFANSNSSTAVSTAGGEGATGTSIWARYSRTGLIAISVAVVVVTVIALSLRGKRESGTASPARAITTTDQAAAQPSSPETHSGHGTTPATDPAAIPSDTASLLVHPRTAVPKHPTSVSKPTPQPRAGKQPGRQRGLIATPTPSAPNLAPSPPAKSTGPDLDKEVGF